jgi:hypothetical protein
MKKRSAHMDFNFPAKEGGGVAKLIPHVNPECVDLIVKLLAYNPDDRLSARQVGAQGRPPGGVCLSREPARAQPQRGSCSARCAWSLSGCLPAAECTRASHPAVPPIRSARPPARQALRHPYFRELRDAEKRQKALMQPDVSSHFSTMEAERVRQQVRRRPRRWRATQP